MRLLRLALLVVGFLALQLSLVGDGVTCSIPSRDAAPAGDAQGRMAGMAGMAMPAASAPAQDAGAHAAHQPAPRPCEDPGAPQSCPASVPCSASFVAAVSVRTLVHVPSAEAPTLVALTPPSLARAPELPPPRA